jgi:hypothetical protein
MADQIPQVPLDYANEREHRHIIALALRRLIQLFNSGSLGGGGPTVLDWIRW